MTTAARGAFPRDHHPETRVELYWPGIGPIPIFEIGEIVSETTSAEAPDHTTVTGGESKPGTVDFKVAMQVSALVSALDAEVEKARGDVDLAYKVRAVVNYPSISGRKRRSRVLRGAWLVKCSDPPGNRGGEGAPLLLTYTVSYDDVLKNDD